MTELEQFAEKARSANVIPVIETLAADLLTPLAVYLKLAAGEPDSFLLESVEGGESLARYSFIGVDPHFSVTGTDTQVTVTDESGPRTISVSMIEFLRDHFRNNRLFQDDSLPSFAGGAIGAFGFACAAWFEPSLRSCLPTGDDSSLMFYRTIVAFDHAKQLIKIVTLVFTDEAGSPVGTEKLFRLATEKNAAVRSLLESGSAVVPPNGSNAENGETESNFSQTEFEDAVREIKGLIAAGEAYQVVLSQCFSKATNASPVAIYRAMRSLNPSPYMFLIRMNGRTMIGASPEMLVRSRDSKLQYRPIAGTRPRGRNTEEDANFAEDMRGDRKEVAEHLMLVDLGRNDLGRVAEFGSVTVSGLMTVEKYSHVQHLVTYLSAKLATGCDRFDALAACFPAGTVSGAPKVRAIEIINRLEPTPRGIYSGAVGYFDYSGNMDTCIAIRTMVLENGIAKVQAGAGIVADSIPEAEFQETINKASALLKAIEIAERM